ncbi:MAG: Long-chain-fatty-acid--CoA ligase [Planctomycetota bacterium]
MSERVDHNVGTRLAAMAARVPQQIAVAVPQGRPGDAPRRYARLTFQELHADSDRIASGLLAYGIPPGSRLVLMVRPGLDFFSLVFALFKARMVTVLIDPGMPRSQLVRCLEEVRPDGFVAIPLAQAIRTLLRTRFPAARHNVTVGSRWFWGGATLAQIRQLGDRMPVASLTAADDPAAIIFTSGSTGAPKGVLYSHRNFNAQIDQIRDFYGIAPGEVDLPGFPLFALFNAAMGVTTIVPDMDFTRPADVDPQRFLAAAEQWQITQAFGSPALWNTVGRHCERTGERFTTLRRVLSAGAPVPIHVLERIRNATREDADFHTPYGATEALPVASISSREVFHETAERSRAGAGTCVGRRFPGIEWRVIRIHDEPIATLEDAESLPIGQIGELMVRGPVVTKAYVTRTDANADHKVSDGPHVWHRMGDVGYFDDRDRFWFCGRKSHRVVTAQGTMFTIPCEAILNNHPHVYRSALVGVGPRPQQRPVMVVEPWPEHFPRDPIERKQLLDELRSLAAANVLTASIDDIRLQEQLPVDVRHNSKIFREKLAVWAARTQRET